MDKNKKKDTYNFFKFKKKINTNNIITGGKKSFSVEKKKSFKGNKIPNKSGQFINQTKIQNLKKNFLQENLLNNKLQKILLKRIISHLGKVSLN